VVDRRGRALEVPGAAGKAFNIGHAPTTQRALVEMLARVAGVEPTLASVPRDHIVAEGGHLFTDNL